MSTQVINDDTVKLLRECNAGIKMGISSIDEVLDNVKNGEFKDILIRCKGEHEQLGQETRDVLNDYNDSGKDPNPIAESMSWIKTNFRLAVDDSDSVIADLITDGCNMGVKSLRRYLNQYRGAEEKVKDLTNRLIRIEEDAANDIKRFL